MTTKFNNTQRKEILRLLDDIGGDGHTIYASSILSEFPDAIQNRFTFRHRSKKGDPTRTIFAEDGSTLPNVDGVYGLSVLGAICNDLGIDCASYHGRGSQAREYTSRILAHFEVTQAANA